MVNRMYIVNDDIPLGCVYEDENGKTKYCPMLNHDDVPYCQYLEDDEAAIGIDERPVYCPIVEFLSAQPEWQKGHWISCSERMPENGEDVLIWLKKKDPCGKNLRIAKLGLHSIENEFFKYLGDKLVWYSHIYYYDIEDVAAWIPLPEPYKMDGE